MQVGASLLAHCFQNSVQRQLKWQIQNSSSMIHHVNSKKRPVVNPKGVPQTLRSYAFSKDPRFPLLHEGKTKSLNNDIEITPMTNMVSENDTGEWFDDMCMQ